MKKQTSFGWLLALGLLLTACSPLESLPSPPSYKMLQQPAGPGR